MKDVLMALVMAVMLSPAAITLGVFLADKSIERRKRQLEEVRDKLDEAIKKL